MSLLISRRACHAMIALCALGLVVVGQASARADGRIDPTVPTVPSAGTHDAHDDGTVVVGGDAEELDRAVVGAAIATAARTAGWTLSGEPVTKQDSDRLLDCGAPAEPWACVPVSLEARGIRRVFVVAVDKKQADNGAPIVILTARLIVSKPQTLVVRQRFCEHCAGDRLAEASTGLVQQLLVDLAVRSGRTVLEVKSTPAGAQVAIDGSSIGVTDGVFNTSPGRHVLTFEKAGYRAEARTVIAEEDKTAVVAVTMVPSTDGAAMAGPGRVTAGVLIGGGALAIVAGGVLLDLGTRSSPSDKYRYSGAAPAGVVIGNMGAVLCAVGVFLWLRAPASTSSMPTVAIPAGGGAVVGFSSAF